MTTPAPASDNPSRATAQTNWSEFVTVTVAGQMLGLPIERVRDVFIAGSVTAVPLAPAEIAGLLNLRGRVVTAICLRRRLGLAGGAAGHEMAVGLDDRGKSYCLLVDQVDEVIKLPSESREPNPVHMDPHWARLSSGIHRLSDRLMTILDIDAVLDVAETSVAEGACDP